MKFVTPVLVSFLCLSPLTALATGYEITDTEFLDAHWSETVLLDENMSSHNEVQAADGGNTGGSPDPYRDMTMTTDSTQPPARHKLGIFHGFVGETYNPFVLGEITEVQFSLDYRLAFSNFNTDSVGLRYRAALMQGGDIYLVPGSSAVWALTSDQGSDWLTTSATFSESDFDVTGSATQAPDFSSADEITFGFYTDLNTISPDAEFDYDADNFRVVIIPEPTTLALVGLGGVAMLRRRTR